MRRLRLSFRNASNGTNTLWLVADFIATKPSGTIGNGMGVTMFFSSEDDTNGIVRQARISPQAANGVVNTGNLLIQTQQ